MMNVSKRLEVDVGTGILTEICINILNTCILIINFEESKNSNCRRMG